jgi:hypothetical protein
MRKTEAGGVPNTFRFNLAGLIIFSLFLTTGTALVTSKYVALKPKTYSFASEDVPDPDQQGKDVFVRKGPWGELLTQNIKLERPDEYISSEVQNPAPETWNFGAMNLDQVRELLCSNGLTREQVQAQATPNRFTSNGTNNSLVPDEDFLFSMQPETRQKLYGGLYGMGVDAHIDYPFIFPNDSIQKVYSNPRIHPDDLALLKHLVYATTNSTRLTDINLLLRRIPTNDRRLILVKALSFQPAVLARLCVRPDSDIDKIASYWGNVDNVRFTDMRPLLEALKGLPNGGTLSLVHFLPPFARSRLYTYPLPSQENDPAMDCHWTTFNFANVEPDNRFNNAAYTVNYIKQNFYQIDSPSIYGDVILYANEKTEIKHSAVFLADDLAFTKYGNNHRQPWMIVRLADMQAMYPALKPFFYRRKVD